YPAPGALSFNYQGNYVSGQKNADIIVRQETQSLRIKRHPEVEQGFREHLRLLGFKIATRQSKALPESAGELFEMVNDSAWLNFTLNASPSCVLPAGNCRSTRISAST
ncbi:hypothetical protein ACNQS2_11310, partial [Corynebacterium diphtheriae]